MNSRPAIAPGALHKELALTYLAVVCAALALISDAYQSGLLSVTNVVFEMEYGASYTAGKHLQLANALILGAISGQVILGIVCDKFGRESGQLLTISNVVIGSIIGAAAHGYRGSFDGLFWCLTIARFIVGFGVGGEIPASSVAAVEAPAHHKVLHRHKMLIYIMVTTGANLVGTPLLCVVILVTLRCTRAYETVWRTAIAFGTVLPFFVLIFRLITRNAEISGSGRQHMRRPPLRLILSLYGLRLTGIGLVYFLYDLTQYPMAIMAGTIISDLVKEAGLAALRKTVWLHLLLSGMAVPGFAISVFMSERWCKKHTIILGFAGYFVFGLALGLHYAELEHRVFLFVVLYGIMLGLGHMGPGNLLGTVTTEAFPTGIRGTMYGFAGAFGRAGAAIGVLCYGPIMEHFGKRYVFIVSASAGGIGAIAAYLLLNKDSLTAKEETERFRHFLATCDWHHPLHLYPADYD